MGEIRACVGNTWVARRVADPWSDGPPTETYGSGGGQIEACQVSGFDPMPSVVYVNDIPYSAGPNYLGWPGYYPSGGGAFSGIVTYLGVGPQSDQPCESIEDSPNWYIETLGGLSFVGTVVTGLATKAAGSSGGEIAISSPGYLRSLVLTSRSLTLLRVGNIAFQIVRAGSIIGGGTLLIEAGYQIARWYLSEPVPVYPGDRVVIDYQRPLITTCPLPPTTTVTSDDLPVPPSVGGPGTGASNSSTDLTTNPTERPFPEPQPVPLGPEIIPPSEEDTEDLDPCCAALVRQIYQVALQENQVAQQVQWVGMVLDQRLAEIRGEIAMQCGDVNKHLERISKGVYHVRPGTSEEYPLAEEILGLLDGLNIYLR